MIICHPPLRSTLSRTGKKAGEGRILLKCVCVKDLFTSLLAGEIDGAVNGRTPAFGYSYVLSKLSES